MFRTSKNMSVYISVIKCWVMCTAFLNLDLEDCVLHFIMEFAG